MWIEFKKIPGQTPITKVPKIRGKNIKNSRILKSKNCWVYWVFKLPYAILLNNQREYTPPIITPVAPKNVIVVLTLNDPTKIKNSPTKLLVPGKLIFAKVKNKKIMEIKMKSRWSEEMTLPQVFS